MLLGGRSLQPNLDQCVYNQYNYHQWPTVQEKTAVGRARDLFTSGTNEYQDPWALSCEPSV